MSFDLEYGSDYLVGDRVMFEGAAYEVIAVNEGRLLTLFDLKTKKARLLHPECVDSHDRPAKYGNNKYFVDMATQLMASLQDKTPVTAAVEACERARALLQEITRYSEDPDTCVRKKALD